MKLRKTFLYSLMLVLTACRFEEEKQPVSKKKVTKDVITAEKKNISRVPISPQSVPYKGQYCFIKAIYTRANTTYIDADYIQFLMGDEAIQAATKKGEAEVVEDDYYVVNDNSKIRTLAVSPAADILLSDAGDIKPSTEKITDSALRKRLRDGIFVLQLNNGLVTEIRQQFVP